MSGHNLSVDSEFRYIVQWFKEWSELQREDFLPILIDYLTKDGGPVIYMNGIVSSMSTTACTDKPLSLFQCRIKLFREWSSKWPEELKIKLKDKVVELDEKLGEKLQEELSTVLTNGNTESTAVEELEVEVGESDTTPALVAVEVNPAAAVAPIVVVPVLNEEVSQIA